MNHERRGPGDGDATGDPRDRVDMGCETGRSRDPRGDGARFRGRRVSPFDPRFRRSRREWHSRAHHHRVFFGLLFVFGLLALLLLGGLAATAFAISQLFFGGSETPAAWVASLLLLVSLPLLARASWGRAYRDVANPLSEVIEASEAVAQGKLDTRVPEGTPGELGRLSRSFNRMATELEDADRQRRNMMADIAHELRTPLHILQGNLEGLQDGIYQPTAEQFSTMLDETRRLGRLVEDLRTLSLAEAGRLPLHKEEVAVSELLSDVETGFGALAEEAGITLLVESDPDDPGATLVADIDRLHQILGNLMMNALRHTPRDGTIVLKSERLTDEIRFVVTDTGSGISPEELPHVFDRYWRANPNSSQGGSGLGLAIARQLVELHGGRISVSSEPGKGTSFTIMLPCRDFEGSIQPSPGSPPDIGSALP